ncbi:LLM class flavin-dependent oxidoreductase [Streptomyces griseorubiginosus]|uniref:LLM class flavin-dependent oxidoreductase n=1 Tax=Streptomyces griseorubiginosus TaxID=67304 RepID=UPI001FCB2E11|nr:LLM class flavin-dependent oxidoreductase [Streptomyces griseorubiginosus]
MRFSVIAGARQRPDKGQSAADAFHTYVDDMVYAEEVGFDACYLGEHHFTFASGNSSPLMMAAAIAARTSTIRVGTSIICAPLHNPVRLAEDLAALDIISNGRCELGIGVGGRWEEFVTFGVDPKERFGRTYEVCEIIDLCLNSGKQVGDRFDWNGKYYQFPDINWVMQTVQERIPILWGGFGPKGARRAGQRGYHLLAPDVTGEYSKAVRENGRDPKDYLILGLVNNVTIGESFEEAFEEAWEPFAWVANQYGQAPSIDDGSPSTQPLYTREDVLRSAKTKKQMGYGGFNVPIAGTVDQVIEHFLPIVRGKHGLITHFGIEVRHPGISTETARRTLKRFAEEVIPVLRAEAAANGL